MDFNDFALKDIFRNGLNDFLNYFMLDNNMLDNNNWTLSQYIDFVLLLNGSPFIVGEVKKNFSTPLIINSILATHSVPEYSHIMAATLESRHVMSLLPCQCLVT